MNMIVRDNTRDRVKGEIAFAFLRALEWCKLEYGGDGKYFRLVTN